MVLAAEGWGVLGGLMGWSPAGVSARKEKRKRVFFHYYQTVNMGTTTRFYQSRLTFCVKKEKRKRVFVHFYHIVIMVTNNNVFIHLVSGC
jgi:hypothetical protein